MIETTVPTSGLSGTIWKSAANEANGANEVTMGRIHLDAVPTQVIIMVYRDLSSSPIRAIEEAV
jgi:hypothetical protein